MSNLTEMGELAKKASRELEGCTCKNEALYAIADSLVARADEIRGLLLEKGIVLEDTREGVKWKRA